MNPTLHHRVHGEGINTEIIIRYNKSVKPYKLYHIATNHIQRNEPKVGS